MLTTGLKPDGVRLRLLGIGFRAVYFSPSHHPLTSQRPLKLSDHRTLAFIALALIVDDDPVMGSA
jgi:hypothetical protein